VVPEDPDLPMCRSSVDGIQRPQPQSGSHLLCIIPISNSAGPMSGTSICGPYIAPHTACGSRRDGMIYITFARTAPFVAVESTAPPIKSSTAIDSGSTNGPSPRHPLGRTGERLYTENEEDGTVSVVDSDAAQSSSPRFKNPAAPPRPRHSPRIAPERPHGRPRSMTARNPSPVPDRHGEGCVHRRGARLEGMPKAAQIAPLRAR